VPGRVLLVADAKMLPALAAGLRELGRFDVATASSLDEAKAQLGGDALQAAIVFYGSSQWTLPAVLQALQPVRDKGGKLVAVLQKAQATQRDECFRSGASDAFFMPIPKEQFVGRLSDTLALSYQEGTGPGAAVQVASRTTPVTLDATVTAAGVHGAREVPFEPGQTVRLSWKSGSEAFSAWGLVASGGPAPRIRFAGLTAEEEARLRSWVKAAESQAAPRIVTASMPTPPQGSTPPRGAVVPPRAPAAAAPRASAAAGPARAAAPPPASARAAAPATAPAAPSAPPPAPAATNAALHNLFDEPGAAPAAAAPAAPEVPLGTPWPHPWPAGWCQAAAIACARGTNVPPGPEGGEAVARRIMGRINPFERAAAEAGGAPLLDAVVARIALAGAQADGEKIATSRAAVLVDAGSMTALTKLADEAGAKLQEEADRILTKGDLEGLRVLTAARSSLSQEVQSFKKMADKLRGLGVADRLGPGGLDPDVQIGASGPARPRTTQPAQQAVKKAEFAEFDRKPAPRRKALWLALATAGLAAALVNFFYFSEGRVREATPPEMERAGAGVVRISVADNRALVVVSPLWATTSAENTKPLIAALAAMGIERAMIQLPDGTPLGSINVQEGKAALTTPRSVSPSARPAEAPKAPPRQPQKEGAPPAEPASLAPEKK
jgi:hypothetical protein